MKRHHALFIILSFVALTYISCDDDKDEGNRPLKSTNANANDTSTEPALVRLEFPEMKRIETTMSNNTRLLFHTTNDIYGLNYTVLWDFDRNAQRWTAYQMTKSYAGSAGYSGDFHEHSIEDKTFSPINNVGAYYSGSGFDRGHICPSADRQYSTSANYQTFCYANIQPQYHMFNAGPKINGKQQYTSPWVRLEDKLRDWIRSTDTDTIYVVKGGTIDDGMLLPEQNYISKKIPVPGYFFVALLRKKKAGYNAIGFWLKHENIDRSNESLSKYAVNIRELERLTGYDFFCNLPDDVEEHVETLPIENARIAWEL